MARPGHNGCSQIEPKRDEANEEQSYQRGHSVVCQNVAARASADLAITVISVEEQLSGWYSLLRTTKRRDHLSLAYQSLADTVPFLARFRILAFPESAVERYARLAASKLNVRKMDLRIAAIALEYDAAVVTRNLRDFQRALKQASCESRRRIVSCQGPISFDRRGTQGPRARLVPLGDAADPAS